ncbi:MAG TPA: DUF3052 domain-containing protein [Clostridia bacterium]|nr:DUF3052 domain-containing protein [Clostridia bacterium]
MSENTSLIKKLQLKDAHKPVLILNAPDEFSAVADEFKVPVDYEPKQDIYGFVMAYGKNNEELKEFSKKAVSFIEGDGLLWICYPKKSSKKYKTSDCDRDTTGSLLGDYNYEPVRQIAMDDDWSALRFRHADNIKTMIRKEAVSEKGKERIKLSLDKNFKNNS